MNATDLFFRRSEIESALNIGADFVGRNHGGAGEISAADRALISSLFTGVEKSDSARIILMNAIKSVVTIKMREEALTAKERMVRLAALEHAAKICEGHKECEYAIRHLIEKEKNA